MLTNPEEMHIIGLFCLHDGMMFCMHVSIMFCLYVVCLFCFGFFVIHQARTALKDHWLYLTITNTREDVGTNSDLWKGFKMNWKQATITFVIAAALASFLLIDLRITNMAGGLVHILRIPVLAILILEISLVLWLFPVMVCFEDKLPKLIRNSVFFALRKVWKLPVLLFFHLFSLYLSASDAQYQPLYAFIWTFFGFGLLAFLDAKLMLPDFIPYLPPVDECGDRIMEPEREESESVYDYTSKVESVASVRMHAGEEKSAQKSEREILEDMKRLGM
jgi:uncharacterized membrane protein YesL